MPTIEVELDDEGKPVKLPEPVQKYLDKIIAFNRREADAKVKDAELRVEAKLSPYLTDPEEMERLRQRDKLLADVELKEAERTKEYEKARKLHEDAAEKSKADAVKAEKANTAKAVEKVRASVAKSIRASALASGARAESLDELERLLAADIDLDPELNEYVVDAKDRKAPRLDADGQPVSIEGLVADYLKSHPHHVAAPSVQGGKARGGATLTGGRTSVLGPTDERSKAREAVTEDPSNRNIANLLRVALTPQ